ncbi:MAG: nitrogen fixation/metabolism regulation signal transduction histidine kinase [Methylophagaceae bacterium]|jgi:nitrogen fixation/metabolism regulation signal transduction histidine kinase
MFKRFNSLQATLLLHELSFILLLLITGAVGIIWSVSWQNSSEESLRIGSMNTTMQNIRGDVYRQLKEVFDATFLHDNDASKEYLAYSYSIQGYLLDLTILANDEQELRAVQLVDNAYDAFHTKTEQLLNDGNAIIDRQELLDKELEKYTFAQLEHAFKNLDQMLNNKQRALSLSKQQWSQRLSWLAPIPVLIAIGLLLLARRFVRTNVVYPLTELVEGARLISKGNLNHKVPVIGVSNLVRLSEAINSMASELANSRDRLIETKKQAALGELIPLVAHNIRNPLAGIRAASQVARDEDVSGSTRDTLTDIMVAVDRLERWVTSLLRYLHPIKPHLTNTTLIAVTDNALSLIELQLADNNISLQRVGWELKAVSLQLDIHLFEQAIFNLVQNALEASSPGNVIQLVYHQYKNKVSLMIHDQGQGMIFDPVAEQVTDGEVKRLSCGLGIPFSLKIIKQHGGRLEYDNFGIDGTSVTITLDA